MYPNYPCCVYSLTIIQVLKSQTASIHMTFIGPDESRMLRGWSTDLAEAALHFLDSCGGIWIFWDKDAIHALSTTNKPGENQERNLIGWRTYKLYVHTRLAHKTSPKSTGCAPTLPNSVKLASFNTQTSRYWMDQNIRQQQSERQFLILLCRHKTHTTLRTKISANVSLPRKHK